MDSATDDETPQTTWSPHLHNMATLVDQRTEGGEAAAAINALPRAPMHAGQNPVVERGGGFQTAAPAVQSHRQVR